MNIELQKLREKIDEIDTNILKLLEKRMNLSKEVAQAKKTQGMQIIDKQREKELINNKKNNSELDKDFIEELFKLIITKSKKIQQNEYQTKG